jgi:hypothetical protein
MPLKGSYLFIAGLGGLIVYSGIKGKGISSALRSVLQGKSPSNATDTSNQIQGAVFGYGAPGVTNTMPIAGPVNSSEKAWCVALLTAIGAPSTSANVNSIAGWIEQETSWTDTPPDGALYTNNPLNTTEPGFGAVGSVNSVGVKIYPTQAQGLAATVAALTNGDYNDILAALRSGNGLTGTYQGLSTWSGGGYDSIGGG